MFKRLLIVVIALVSVAWTQSSSDLKRVLEKAAAYVAEYERLFSAVVAEERYVQWVRGLQTGGVSGIVVSRQITRELRSDVLMTQVSGDTWVAFRDVYEVDGHAVRDRDARLQKLFLESPSTALSQAQRVMQESAKYNIGSLQRNVNVPTMALTYLRGANQSRSAFTVSGRGRIGSLETVTLSFKEQARPTVIQSAKGDLDATGRFWIEVASGRVLRTELMVAGEFSKTRITVAYQPMHPLAMWVPITMDEGYTLTRGETITANAQYGRFRQFTVTATVK